jgi:hypothetical protein
LFTFCGWHCAPLGKDELKCFAPTFYIWSPRAHRENAKASAGPKANAERNCQRASEQGPSKETGLFEIFVNKRKSYCAKGDLPCRLSFIVNRTPPACGITAGRPPHQCIRFLSLSLYIDSVYSRCIF